MAGPPLAAARATAEAVFDAACTITRDVEGTTDDVRDEANLTSTPPAADSTTVYSGPCLLRPPTATTAAQAHRQGGAQIATEDLRARVPATVTSRPGDILTVTASPNDPSLAGRSFDVTRVIAGSYAVTRMLLLADRARGPRL